VTDFASFLCVSCRLLCLVDVQLVEKLAFFFLRFLVSFELEKKKRCVFLRRMLCVQLKKKIKKKSKEDKSKP